MADAELVGGARDLLAGGVDRDEATCCGFDVGERGRLVPRDPVAIFGGEGAAELGDGVGRVGVDDAMELGGPVGQVGNDEPARDVGAVGRKQRVDHEQDARGGFASSRIDLREVGGGSRLLQTQSVPAVAAANATMPLL